jgi:hypothetical protein
MSIWLPVDVIRLIKADRLNMTQLNLDILEVIYGGDTAAKTADRSRLVEAAHKAFGRQRQVDAEREADRERALDIVRQMRAEREASRSRQDAIADALLQVAGDDPPARLARLLPERDPNGDRMDEWDALVRRVSRLCGAEIDSAEVAEGQKKLIAAA